jgi:hypothetical protein
MALGTLTVLALLAAPLAAEARSCGASTVIS